MKHSRFDAAATLLLFVGALLASLHANGLSPIAWTDMSNDDYSVHRCVVQDTCTLEGTGTSVRGFLHAVSWFELRSLLAWLGLWADGTHVVIQILNALAAAFVFAVARRLGGRLAGILAFALFLRGFASLQIETTAIYNSPPLAYLGAVFAVASIAVVLRPGVISVTLAAAVAAIMANTHLACVVSGMSVVLAALAAPRRRIAMAVVGAVAFAVATALIAPPLWLSNVATLMNRPPPHGNQPLPPRLEGGELIWWSLLGVAIYLVSLRSPSAAWRRCRLLVRGPFAVTLPFVFAFLCAWAVGIDATAKYLAHTVAATAIATALLVARAARQLFAAAVANPARRQTALRAVQAAPFALALLLPIVSRPLHSGKPTVSELRQVRDLLHDRYGWTAEQVMSNLRAGYGIAALQGLRRIEIADPRPPRQPRDPYATAILLFVDRDDLPDPLPPNWEIIRSARRALVLITTRSRLDWSRFEVCLRLRNAPEQPCQESSLLFDPDAPGLEAPNMPWGGPHWDGILALRAPLRPGEPSDPTEAIFMPRMQLVCGGYVAGDSAGALHVDADRRQALLSPGPGDGNRVELQWDLGSRDCPIGYDGWLPFIVAGDADTVQRIAALLRKAEADGAR